MKQMRRNIFETNSSSVHAISIDGSGLEPSNFIIDKDGTIYTEYGQFGKNYEIFNTQYDKLSYLVSLCYYFMRGYGDDIYDCWEFQSIEEAVCEYTGAEKLRISNVNDYPGIDHQMQPYGVDDCIVNLYSQQAIIDFVFNKYVSLVTDCD